MPSTTLKMKFLLIHVLEKMCRYASTDEQRKAVIQAIIPVAHQLDYYPYQPMEIYYRQQVTPCGHEGTCHVDKEHFVKDILFAIQHQQWNLVSALFSKWDEWLSYDLIHK